MENRTSDICCKTFFIILVDLQMQQLLCGQLIIILLSSCLFHGVSCFFHLIGIELFQSSFPCMHSNYVNISSQHQPLITLMTFLHYFGINCIIVNYDSFWYYFDLLKGIHFKLLVTGISRL